MRRLVVWLGFVSISALGNGAENWSPVVIPTGEYRAQIQATPIPERPGRLLHVYGNTIRWMESTDEAPLTYRPLRRIVVGTDGIRPTSDQRRTSSSRRPAR